MIITLGRAAKKILIVDDDLQVANFLAKKCKLLGFEVETATNGIKAVSIAKEFEPDILVVDVHMPEINGFSIASGLLDPAMRSIEVIAISGHFTPLEAEEWRGLGATCVNKGASFWVQFAEALIELFPNLSNVFDQMRAFDAEVRKRVTVLLVDDDKSITDFLSSRFYKLGVEPIVAPNGIEAFRLAKRGSPSVIVTDYYMRNGDAEYLLNKLRQAQETKHVPVIVQTGRELEAHVRTRLKQEILGEAGAAHILRKSWQAQNLFDTLKSYYGFVGDPVAHFETPIVSPA